MLENGGNQLGWFTVPAVDRFMENIGSGVLIVSKFISKSDFRERIK